MGDVKPTSDIITRKKHLFFMQVFSIVSWVIIAYFISTLFPYYGGWKHVGIPVNINVLWFIPSGILWGFIIGLVLNRLMLVHKTKEPSARLIPISFLARFGRRFTGWLGLLIFVISASSYVSIYYMKMEYYCMKIAGKAIGLSAKSAQIRYWTLVNVYKSGDPEFVDTLTSLIKDYPSGEWGRYAFVALSFRAEQLGNKRAFIEVIIAKELYPEANDGHFLNTVPCLIENKLSDFLAKLSTTEAAMKKARAWLYKNIDRLIWDESTYTWDFLPEPENAPSKSSKSNSEPPESGK